MFGGYEWFVIGWENVGIRYWYGWCNGCFCIGYFCCWVGGVYFDELEIMNIVVC